ncbi:(Fe-S)-binding protein [Puniceicoccales bacterium CK1056]|uniref:(Fe-S)-binding protein n=1 Tax=Oceanipulchritudo coccoides TaxID=2706888 RepID=A0A6B2M284_9BACT|nr:(Fe-S)-binding protein [Oceanipulchritudo coccoides]NDV62843.1 (Fe-S)-binding protein [Oceanipulchritudo coccoides]
MSLLHTPPNRPAGKSIQLMTTCLCDAFYADVARATVEILEYLGCDIELPDGQTCCGQPAFNGGDWKSSRKVVRHTAKVFAGDKPIIVPSGSCAAMIFHGAPLAFEKESDIEEIQALAARTWELTDYIVNGLGIKEWPGKYEGLITVHRSCHLRGSNSGDAITTLMESIDGLELGAMDEKEQCCGFGGTFAVSFPNISKKMGDLKVENLTACKPDAIAAADMGCMMHFGGMMDKQGNKTNRLHVAQILRNSLQNAGLL